MSPSPGIAGSRFPVLRGLFASSPFGPPLPGKVRLCTLDIVLIAGLAFCASTLRAATPAEPERVHSGTGKTCPIDTPVNIATGAKTTP